MSKLWTRNRPAFPRIDRQAPLAKGLVFAGLGGGASTLHYSDASGYGNHGVLTNMDPPTDWVWVQELGRWGVDGDGSNDLIAIQRQPVGAETITLAAWIYHRGGGNSFGRLFDNGKLVGFCEVSNERMGISSDGFATGVLYCDVSSLTLDTWTHWAAVRNSDGTATHFQNGTALTSGASGTPAAGTTGASLLNRAAGDRAWDGLLADAAIYNRALSLPEIQQLADPSNVMLSGLILPPRRRLFASAGGAPAVNAPTGHLYGPLVGSLGGPV